MKMTRKIAVIALGLVTAITAAGCSSTGGRPDTTGGGIGAGQADTERATVAMVAHAPAGDTFWDLIRQGAEAAAQKNNFELRYASDPQAPNQANMLQSMIDARVAGIATTMPSPSAMRDTINRAHDAGIPLVGFNAGADDWQDLGLLSYFGQDETVAGRAFGERLNEVGAQHTICVIQAQGQVQLEARCAGIAETFQGRTEILNVQGEDAPGTQSTIAAKLRQDPNIDYVATLGAPIALIAAQAIEETGADAGLATFDLNRALIDAIRTGTVEFAVDQQPYLQGYLAIDALWLYINNRNYSGGGVEPVLTGPAFVDQDNIDEIAEFAERGTR